MGKKNRAMELTDSIQTALWAHMKLFELGYLTSPLPSSVEAVVEEEYELEDYPDQFYWKTIYCETKRKSRVWFRLHSGPSMHGWRVENVIISRLYKQNKKPFSGHDHLYILDKIPPALREYPHLDLYPSGSEWVEILEDEKGSGNRPDAGEMWEHAGTLPESSRQHPKHKLLQHPIDVRAMGLIVADRLPESKRSWREALEQFKFAFNRTSGDFYISPRKK